MTSTPKSISKKLPEFCEYCGAGLYTFRRFGEGTCNRCDPKRSAVETTGCQECKALKARVKLLEGETSRMFGELFQIAAERRNRSQVEP